MYIDLIINMKIQLLRIMNLLFIHILVYLNYIILLFIYLHLNINLGFTKHNATNAISIILQIL